MLLQSDAVHLLVDAAGNKDGVLIKIRDKSIAIPQLHCAVTTIGAYNAQDRIVETLRDSFSSFDEMVAEAGPALQELFESEKGRWSNRDSTVGVWIIGFSEERARPECYIIWLASDAAFAALLAETAKPPEGVAPFVMMPATGLQTTPTPTLPECLAAGLAPRGSVDDFDPAVDLLHLMEIQRRSPFSGRNGAQYYAIGGFALLTTIDRSGIYQRVLHRWREDVAGGTIQPAAISWADWRAGRDAREERVNPLGACGVCAIKKGG